MHFYKCRCTIVINIRLGITMHVYSCNCNLNSYFQTLSVRYFAGTYLSSCTRSPHRSLISIWVWEWSTSSCSDRQKESGNNAVKENTVWENTSSRWREMKYFKHLSINIQNTLAHNPQDTYTLLIKRAICAQHSPLFHTVSCTASGGAGKAEQRCTD